MHDELTGLPNRNLFLDRLRMTLARVQRRPDRVFAVMFLCLDRFGSVVKELGVAVGDSVLLEVTRRLLENSRPQDTVARLEADEFAVMLDDLLQPGDAYPVAERLQAAVRRPVILDGHCVHLTGSIGLVLVTGDYHRADDVVQTANLALDMAKMNGGGQSAVAPMTH